MAHITNTGARRAQGVEPIRPSMAGRNRSEFGRTRDESLASYDGRTENTDPLVHPCFACGVRPCECEGVTPITAQVMRDVNRMFKSAIDRSAFRNGSLGMRLLEL